MDPPSRSSLRLPLAFAFFLLAAGSVVRWCRGVDPGPPVTPTPSPTPTVTPTPPDPTWPLARVEPPAMSDDRDLEGLREALVRGIAYLRKKPAGAAWPYGPDTVPASRVLATLERVDAELARRGLGPGFFTWLRGACEVYQTTREVTFTGYHLASLRASRQRGGKYRYPLYRRPDDHLRIELSRFDFFDQATGVPKVIPARVRGRKVVPYYSRAEIDFQGVLAGKGAEILWADSLLDVHSLHVQGSGVVQLDTGDEVLVGFADSNGRRFRGIGGYLLGAGRIPPNRSSPSAVNAFLEAHPEQVEEVLSANARYIFFRELKGGPLGALGVELTAHRAIATDLDVFPPGALVLIESQRPEFDDAGKVRAWHRFQRLVLNFDTGAAIRGPARADLYCGYGPDNQRIAEATKKPGSMRFLLLKP